MARLFRIGSYFVVLASALHLFECSAEIVYTFNDTDQAYASSKPWSSSYDELRLDFATKLGDSLLFVLQGTGDFLQLTLRNGDLVLAVKIRDQFNTARANQSMALHDGKRHSLKLVRQQHAKLSVSVDGQHALHMSVSKVWPSGWDRLYVGGLPNEAAADHRVQSEPKFRGCISGLSFGKSRSQALEQISFESTRAVGEALKCPLCVHDIESCAHGGQCTIDGMRPCQCRGTGYSGTHCQTGNPLVSQLLVVSYSFFETHLLASENHVSCFARHSTMAKQKLIKIN